MPMATPPRTAPQGKPPADLSTKSQPSAPTTADIGKNNGVPAAGQEGPTNSASVFNQMVTQIVAESAALDTPAPPAPAQTLKLPAKPNVVPVSPLADLPAPAWTIAAAPTVPAILSAGPLTNHRQDTRATAATTKDNPAQPPALPVDVNVPIPIVAKLPEPSFADKGSADSKPDSTAPVSHAEEPVAIELQPKPVLEVNIHFNQPVTGTSFIPKETPPAAESSVTKPVVAANTTKPEVTNPEAMPTGKLPASVPAVVAGQKVAAPTVAEPITAAPLVSEPVTAAPMPAAPVVAAPAAAAPVVASPVVATQVLAAPVAPVAAHVVTAPVAPVPVPAVVATPVAAAPVAAAQPVVDARLTTRGDEQDRGRQQNPQREAPDPGEADINPATTGNVHTIARTTISQAPVVVQQPKLDAAAPLPLHIATAAPGGAVQAGAAPVHPLASPVTMNAANPKAEPQTVNAALREEPLIDRTRTQQPVRSLALEFTPDGAGDVKVRLSERAGDVHISLHGTDPSLAGRMREGVSDLVGSLSNAGYDAEAWTPGQGHQNQRQESEQRKASRGTSGGADAEEFSGILQQPIQEIS